MRPLLFLTLAAPWVLATPGAAQETDDAEPRFFSVSMSRDARELAATAEEHLHDQRYEEAFQVLQRILEEHPGEVLPTQWRDNAELPSVYDAYPGAAEWALARLTELPASVREQYRSRFEPHAAEALARALRTPRRDGLLAVARRWPLTPSAARAWFCLGDIELESGHLQGAELSWQRGLEIARHLDMGVPVESAARLELVRARRVPEKGFTSKFGGASIPRGDTEPWTTLLDLTPFAQRGNRGIARYNLLPVVLGDKLLVSSTLRLFALDAFTGRLLWQAGPPRGWSALSKNAIEDLFVGVNYDQLVMFPAGGDGVALAALQTPFAENENEEWQQIHIMSSIPERRLYAFDLETGRELWNHAPPLTWDGVRWRWDGTSGTYAQRMMVAAPPTVAGSRVLVPCYRMQGRIDYQVACYELESGELSWTTPVISGQRERNMFGRSKSEFAATPLVVVGDRVIAQTELGTVAALDLFSGRILWQSLYRQIPLPKTRSYTTPTRPSTWKLAPPVVVGDLVLSTPSDSEELVAFLVSDGRVAWAHREDALQDLVRRNEHLGFDLLLGADEDTVYLAGGRIAALQKPGGLATSSPIGSRWATEPLARPDSALRAVLTPGAILSPNALGRTAFDRRTGAQIPAMSGTWGRGEAGNVWLGDGALFSLSPLGVLSGYLDWQALLERARMAAESAADPRAILEAARLFQRRGLLALESADSDPARQCLTQACEFYARLRQLGRPQGEEFECLVALAHTYLGEGRVEEALGVLADARDLGAEGAALSRLLFEEERCWRGRDSSQRIAVLDQLALLDPEARPSDLGWSDAVKSWFSDQPGADALAPAADELTTGEWVRVERAAEHLRLAHLGPALEDLHAALESALATQAPGGSLLENVIRAEIGRVLALPGGRSAFAPLEERAQALLVEARRANDPARLEEIVRRFPQSQAADVALEERLEQAVQAGDARAVASIAAASLASSALPAERETHLLLRLGRVLGEIGNTALEGAILAEVASRDPGAFSDLPAHAGRTVGTLAAEHAREIPESAPVPVLFDSSVLHNGHVREGRFKFLGSFGPLGPVQESSPHELHAYATEGRIEVYSSQDPTQPVWTRALDGLLAAGYALANGRVLLGTREGILCLDEGGHDLWLHPTDGEAARRLVEWNGLVIAQLTSGRVLVLETQQGILLWERMLGEAGSLTGPVVGDGRAVFFSALHGLPPRALVLDLFRGRVVADFPLSGLESNEPLETTAWIAGHRLIAPAFAHPSRISAFSLADGERAWTLDFGRDEVLQSLAYYQDRSFPVTRGTGATDPSAGKNEKNGSVYELEETSGTLKRIVPLKQGERPMGLEGRSRIELASSYLFSYSTSDKDKGVSIRAIHLQNGVQWTWSLPVSSQEFYDGPSLSMPAVSADCVAISYRTRASRGGPISDSTVVFVDMRAGNAGKKLDQLFLGEAFDAAQSLELHGLGEALFVLGRAVGPRGSCLEILEKVR